MRRLCWRASPHAPSTPCESLGDFQFGYNDYSFTRISPRQVQSYKIHASYKPRTWINFDGAVDIHENRDNVSTINDIEHGRSYSFVTTLMPNAKLFFDLGYTYTDINNQAQICYYTKCFWPPASNSMPGQPRLCTRRGTGLGFLFQQTAIRLWRHHLETGQASDFDHRLYGHFCWREHAGCRSTPGSRDTRFQLSKAIRDSDLRPLQGSQLPHHLELLRIQREGTGLKRNSWPRSHSHAGFQRQYG